MPFYSMKPDQRWARRDQSVGVTTAGGFLVPQEIAVRFWSEVLNDLFMDQISTTLVPNSRQPRFIIEDPLAMANWVAEGAAIPTPDSIFVDGGPGILHKIVAGTAASEEFLQDARAILAPEPNSEGGEATGMGLIDFIQARRLRRSLNDAVVNGTGINQPLGIIADPNSTSVVGAIDAANINLMYVALTARYINEAVWICNPTSWPTFRTAAGDGLSVQGDGQIQVLERPVLINPYVPANNLIFGRLASYSMLVSEEMGGATDTQTLAATGRVQQFATTRADGRAVIGTGGEPAFVVLTPAP